MKSELKSNLLLILTTPLLFNPDSITPLLYVGSPIIELKRKWCLVYIRDLWELEPSYSLNTFTLFSIVWIGANNGVSTVKLEPLLYCCKELFWRFLCSLRLIPKRYLVTAKEAYKPAVWELETSDNLPPIISLNTTLWVEFTVGRASISNPY